jgi:glyceraldehyde 3-phosphate dehydrogenase
MAIKVLINGFGRIGRTVLRAWAEGARAGDGWPQVEIVGVNDIVDAETCAYLFEYDSVFGPWRGDFARERGAMVLDGRRVTLSHEADLTALDLSDIDLVMECTGLAGTVEVSGRGLAAGARRVLISGPSDAAEMTVVLGANEDRLTPDHRVISNASCTTNALAPLVRLIHREFGIATGYMTTVHCYTGSQPTVDKPRGDPARSRAAALSIVPTTTSASRLLDRVLPEVSGRIEGAAVRVPVASVSAVDLTVMTERPCTVDQVNALLRAAPGGVIGWTDRPLVSSDLRARPESIVMALPETAVTAGGMLRVFGWYDNEWGFSCRMLDMAVRWAG